MTDVETRVAVVETTQRYHASKLEKLETEVRTTVDKLSRIERQLAQIKWIAIGAIGAKVASEMGIFTFLSKILL